jgi:hypothetical protein
MHTLETFRQRTHSRGEIMQSLSVGLKTAREVIGAIDDTAMETLAVEAREYLPAVMTEIDELQTAIVANPAELARRAVLFGIATPNRDEVHSLAWAMAAAPHYGARGPVDLAETTYVGPASGKQSRIGLRQALAKSLEDVYTRFDDVRPTDLSPNTLETVRGIGPKVARMITAVANPSAHVWTVDLWHIRQLLWAAGLEYRARASVDARLWHPRGALAPVSRYLLQRRADVRRTMGHVGRRRWAPQSA